MMNERKTKINNSGSLVDPSIVRPFVTICVGVFMYMHVVYISANKLSAFLQSVIDSIMHRLNDYSLKAV